jgi:hypothetical protein
MLAAGFISTYLLFLFAYLCRLPDTIYIAYKSICLSKSFYKIKYFCLNVSSSCSKLCADFSTWFSHSLFVFHRSLNTYFNSTILVRVFLRYFFICVYTLTVQNLFPPTMCLLTFQNLILFFLCRGHLPCTTILSVPRLKIPNLNHAIPF